MRDLQSLARNHPRVVSFFGAFMGGWLVLSLWGSFFPPGAARRTAPIDVVEPVVEPAVTPAVAARCSPARSFQHCSTFELNTWCQVLAQQKLLFESTADFVGAPAGVWVDGRFVSTGVVRAQNSFGAFLPYKYGCVFKSSGEIEEVRILGPA